AEARDTHRTLCEAFLRHGPVFPAVATRQRVPRNLTPVVWRRQDLLAGSGLPAGFWPRLDELGTLIVWEQSLDAARSLAGTRHPLRRDSAGFIAHRQEGRAERY